MTEQFQSLSDLLAGDAPNPVRVLDPFWSSQRGVHLLGFMGSNGDTMFSSSHYEGSYGLAKVKSNEKLQKKYNEYTLMFESSEWGNPTHNAFYSLPKTELTDEEAMRIRELLGNCTPDNMLDFFIGSTCFVFQWEKISPKLKTDELSSYFTLSRIRSAYAIWLSLAVTGVSGANIHGHTAEITAKEWDTTKEYWSKENWDKIYKLNDPRVPQEWWQHQVKKLMEHQLFEFPKYINHYGDHCFELFPDWHLPDQGTIYKHSLKKAEGALKTQAKKKKSADYLLDPYSKSSISFKKTLEPQLVSGDKKAKYNDVVGHQFKASFEELNGKARKFKKTPIAHKLKQLKVTTPSSTTDQKIKGLTQQIHDSNPPAQAHYHAQILPNGDIEYNIINDLNSLGDAAHVSVEIPINMGTDSYMKLMKQIKGSSWSMGSGKHDNK